MDAIFREFAVESGQESKPLKEQDEVLEQSKDVFNVPVALAIE